jgi:hypothetical protein
VPNAGAVHAEPSHTATSIGVHTVTAAGPASPASGVRGGEGPMSQGPACRLSYLRDTTEPRLVRVAEGPDGEEPWTPGRRRKAFSCHRFSRCTTALPTRFGGRARAAADRGQGGVVAACESAAAEFAQLAGTEVLRFVSVADEDAAAVDATIRTRAQTAALRRCRRRTSTSSIRVVAWRRSPPTPSSSGSPCGGPARPIAPAPSECVVGDAAGAVGRLAACDRCWRVAALVLIPLEDRTSRRQRTFRRRGDRGPGAQPCPRYRQPPRPGPRWSGWRCT